MAVNKVLLLGTIAGLSYVEEAADKDGVARCNFTLAINDIEKVNFYKIKAEGKLSDMAYKHLSKGDAVLIEGKLMAGYVEAENINFIRNQQ